MTRVKDRLKYAKRISMRVVFFDSALAIGTSAIPAYLLGFNGYTSALITAVSAVSLAHIMTSFRNKADQKKLLDQNHKD